VAKLVRLRQLAADDVDTTISYLTTEASHADAERFVTALERAPHHIARHPHTGSLCFSYELDIPELRAWPLGGFPYVVFYVEATDEIDVWRVLHSRRDIPSTLADNDAE
jgi:toxin ParE1/3/4